MEDAQLRKVLYPLPLMIIIFSYAWLYWTCFLIFCSHLVYQYGEVPNRGLREKAKHLLLGTRLILDCSWHAEDL